MGTTQTHYVMFAVRLPFPKDDALYEPYEDNGYSRIITIHNGLTIVSDGMNSGYMFIGKVLSKGLDYEGLEITDCSPCSDEERKRVVSIIKDKFNIENPEVRVWAFTHFH